MTYTESQKALISSMLETRIAPRTKSESLRNQLVAAHARMYADALTESDLILIGSALELLVTDTPETGSKEEWTDLIQALMTTRRMTADASERHAGE